ncbi:MAG: hypothetical protein HQ581_16335 [Planctomycetes bacterium]|nr:hypothetical protein [Planctomycetota bacterium]
MNESRRMRFSAWLCGVLLLGLSSSAFGNEEPKDGAGEQQPAREVPIGAWGNPRRIEIEGAETFTPEAITDALLSNWNVMRAAHPSAGVSQYASILQATTLAGYRNEGFPDVKVAVAQIIGIGSDPGSKDGAQRLVRSLQLTIEEGPRFTCGEVRITGADRMVVELLVERLTGPYLPTDATSVLFEGVDGKTEATWVDRDGKEVELKDPVWQPGEPAPFAEASGKKLRRQIAAAMADLGYHFATFDPRVVPRKNKERPTADLRIDITDEGPRAEIARIEIEGNEKNSDQEIIEYLALEPGVVFDRQEQVRVAQRLWRSGRFVSFSVEPQKPETEGEPLWLKIDVAEYPKAPRLSEPLSAEETAMLACRDWIANPARWQSDMIVSIPLGDLPGAEFEMIVSPDRGVTATYGKPDSRRDFNWALVAADGRAGLYSNTRQRKLETRFAEACAVAEINLSMTEEPDDPQRPYRQTVHFGAGLTSRDAAADPPFRVKLKLDPCHFLAMVHEHDAKCESRQGILTLHSRGHVWRVEASSGRLIDLDFRPEKAESQEQFGVRMRFEKNAMAERLRKIQAVSADYANDFDDRRPVSSLLGFACRETMAWEQLGLDARQLATLQIAASAIDAGALGPLDDLVADDKTDDEDEFSIPGGLDGAGNMSAASVLSQAFWGRLALMYADDLFPRLSWPWVVWRETALVVGGEPKYADRTLSAIAASRSTGPICFLTVASLLDRVNPNVAHQFAKQGLTRLSVEAFRNDYRPLLDKDFPIGKSVLHMAKVLRDMDDPGVRAITESLDAEASKRFRQAVEVLRRGRDKPITEALGDVLDALWENGLRDRVKKALESIEPVKLPPDSAITQVSHDTLTPG